MASDWSSRRSRGHAVKLGVRYAVPTPTLFAVYAALKPYLSGLPQELPV